MTSSPTSGSRFAPWALLLPLLVIVGLLTPATALAQNSDDATDRERLTAERYLQVLLRRPRPGVALDRVYGYHVQNDSLDDLEAQLTASDANDEGGPQMVWGLIQLQRGRSADAATILAAAESKRPDDAACSFYLGRAYLAVGKTEQAAAAMERAIERGPSRAEALPMFTELGRIYSRAGEREKSLAVWTRLEKLFPGDSRVGGQIARTLAEEGNYAEAQTRYEKLSHASQKADETIAFAVQAAEMRRNMGESDEATELLEKILARLRPGSWLYTDVRNRIEAGFLRSGDYDALADYYQSQLDDRPDDLALRTRLSRIMITAGRLTEAKSLLETAISRAPDDGEARLTLIDVLVNQGDIAAAAKQFEELARRDSDNPDHLIRWGQILLEDTEQPLDQRRSAAANVWSRLAKTRSDDAVTLSQIADMMRGIDRSEDAIDLYRQSIALDPGAPQYREYLGEYLHSLDRKDEAIEVWKSIAAEDRRGRESLVRLAEVLGTFKLPDLALQAWKDASEFDLTFVQELRFAAKLSEAKQYDTALLRLDRAESLAETPDEHEQLLKDRIGVYQSSGTLAEQIQTVSAQEESVETLRKLALMHGAAGDLLSAERSIRKAIELAPDRAEVLLIAADLAERQNRFSDAAELFTQLASADNRFRTNYLQRVSSLLVRLGQIDKALETCEAIIDANPASPESYLFYARTAFAASQDEAAIAALRRAMTVAPRDNAPRKMLAGHFADRYRTDEAIELYWQAFNFEPKTDDKINLISSLAPLYDRKADLDTLIGRIEEINRKDGDTRSANLMVAAAQESVQDYGAARNAIEQLLANQPRDITLLETMVRLSDAADEVELAAEYQQRITELANTPENRFKLVQYQLESGEIDVAQALSQRIAFLSDPSRLATMVRSTAARGDLKTARTICEEVLRSDDSLWDIKLTLAQLLLMDRGGEDTEQTRAKAIKLAREVRSAEIPTDAPAPTRRRQTTRRPNANQRPANYLSNPMYWSQSSYQIAQALRVGRYASSSYSSQRTSTIEPTSFGHARIIAASLILLNEVIDKTGDEAVAAIEQKLETELSLPDIETTTDAVDVWEQFALMSVVSLVTNTPNRGPFGAAPANLSGAAKAKAEASRKRQLKMMWRLAEIDPAYGITPLLSMLGQRMMSDAAPPQQKPDMTPLTEAELVKLAQLNERIQQEGFPTAVIIGGPSGMAEMMLQAIVGYEFKLAGLEERAAEFSPRDLDDDADYDTINGAIQFYLRLNQFDQAGNLVARLLPAARRAKPQQPIQGISPSIQIMLSGNESAKDFFARHQTDLIDAVIARWSKQTTNTAQQSTTLGDGYLNTYTQYGGGYRSVRVRGPLSPRLMDSALVQEVLVYAKTPENANTLNSRSPKLELATEVIKHLESPLAGASGDEEKTRRVIAAYAHWWSDRPEKCYASLVKLCEDFSADVDLQIERARLASELKQPRVALEALDSFSPLDSRMLVRKEMAAMNLAAEIGDTDRAKVAAERLFGMRLDVQMQLALADQLKRLGLNDQATAMLARTRSGRVRDENTELQIARAFLSAGDQDSAAEVAYALMRRLSSGRSGSNNNSSYYQQQVASILQSAGRLEPLIQRAKRRVESSPNATRPKQELAELYTAAGRTDEANQVWETLSKDVPSGAPQLITRADALVQARKHKQAVELYLDAFEKDPSRFSNDFYKLTNAVRSAGEEATDDVFRRLMKFPIDQIPTYRMDELARLGPRNELSDAKRDFIGYMLKSPAAKTQIYSIVGNLNEEQRSQIPEYRDAMIASICSDDAFVASSTIWQVRSRSSGGRAIGPLADAVSMLQKDDDAQKQFREAATKALETESHQLNAKFLLALVDSNQSDKLESSLASMRDCIKRDPDDQSNTATVSSGLLWQTGQILETEANVPVDFLVDLYVEAKRTDSSSSGSSPQFTLDSRLVDTYIKAERFDEARQRLLDLFRSVDFSEQNRYNPGYGDYQQLQAAGWVAEQLLKCNAPIDSLIIYRGQLADPDSFDRAQRWGGSRDRKTAFETGAETAAEQINAEVALAHLDRQVDAWEKDLDATPIDLMECSSQTITTTETPSSLELAIRIAVGDEKTRAQVIEFQQRVEKLSKSNVESWELAALNLMTGCFLGSDQTTELANTLFERLPDAAELKPGQDPDSNTISDAVKAISLFDLYPVARAASRSESESNQQIGKRLVNYISAVAESSHDSSIALALAEISGDVSESISRILDVIQSQAKPDAPLPESTVNQCLQVAKDAANAGQIETTVRALKLALQNGPPLRKISNSGDAFAISTSANYSGAQNSNDQNAMDELISKVSEITIALSQASGVPLRFNEQESPANANSEVNPDSISEIADAYLTILAPATREATVFSYAQPIATRSYDRISPNENLVVASASTAFAMAAAEAGRTETVRKLIEKRMEQGGDPTELSITLVQLAVAARQPVQLERSIDRFTTAIDNRLPEPSERISAPGQATTISSQMASDSQRKSEVINHVLHAIWPIVATDKLWKPADEDPEQSEAIFSKVASLMLRTENLINSDSYTASRHREIKRRLAEKQVAIAKAYGNTVVVDDYIKSQLDQIETQAYPSGSNIEDYKRRALESLTTKLIDDGLIEYLDPIFRQGIATHSARQRNYSSRFESQCCLAISQLPPDKRLELLSKITFGRSGQEPLAYFDALVSYEVPPPLVARQHPMLDAVINLETSTQDYPVVNSYLMLIDAAAAVGQTDAIRQKLLPQKKTAGDETDIALALLDLAAAKGNDATGVLQKIRPTLDAVAANLANNLPKQNDKDLPFPAIESHLIVRAFQSGMPVDVVKPLIQNVKTYAIRGQRNFIVSAVARATSQMGIGRAAGATADSPLEHFHIVSLPARYRGDNPRLQPLYAVAADGWISGTSGYEQTHLMFKYPVTGSFTISANIEDGGWGESDIAYGGVIFQANGWQQTAKVLGMGNRGQVEFKVASIQRGKLNEEAVSVSPENVQGVCNGQSYVTDLPPAAYPFASLHHHKYRTTRFRDLHFTGNPTIPDEVNLIDPSMRGWGVLTHGRSIPKMLMPIGPKQNKEQILSFRKKMTEDLAKGPLVGGWSVREDQLHFKSRPGSATSSDPASHIEYLRPFQDGESIEIEFYWKNGQTEFAPTVGRTILKLSDKGTTPDWIVNSGDLASVGLINANSLDPPYDRIAADNVPKEDDWNNLVMKRTSDQVAITLNGQPLAEVPVAGHERPGIYRNERRDLIVRTIRLTGDWPDEFPAELIANQ